VVEVLGLTLVLWAAGALAQACPVPGEKIWWIADYCMAKLETDDEIAAGACINQELEIRFSDDCLAKRYFKRQLCQVVQRDRASECARDPKFAGPTVRNGGVGR
jgi:hypothetical protein